MILGVQTHFSQGWERRVWSGLQGLGNPPVRDTLVWAEIEQAPNIFRLTRDATQFMFDLSKAQSDAIITIAHSNPNYDGGKTPFSDDAIKALAEYAAFLVADLGTQIRAIEIGNEINGGNNSGPASTAVAQTHVRQLRAVFDAVKAVDPNMPVLGGAVHSVPIGFLDAVFALGGLQVMDGIAVHPYRPAPEGLEAELAALKVLMDQHGRRVPIYVTEFGAETEDPRHSADYLVKMVCILSASGVKAAYWYAAMEQRHFKNMGLFDQELLQRPAAAAFQLMRDILRNHGPIHRIETDRTFRLYSSFDDKVHILWGTGQAISLPEGTRLVDAAGVQLEGPVTLSGVPVIALGAAPHVETSRVFADSLLQYAEQPWHYGVVHSDGKIEPLSRIDWEWTSYLGTRTTKPAAVFVDSVVLSGPPNNLIAISESVVAPFNGPITIHGTWSVAEKSKDGVRLTITYDDVVLLDETVVGELTVDTIVVEAQEGGVLSFVVHPGVNSEGDRIIRRITLMKDTSL